MATSTNAMTPVLRYVPKAHRKERESPFSGVVNGKAQGKIIRKANEASLGALKEVPYCQRKRCSLPGFVSFSKALLKEEEGLPHTRTKQGFDPNAYKLVERVGYYLQNPTILGKVIEVKPHGLNETQKMIQERGGSVGVSKVGLGYASLPPIRISGRRKNKQSAVQHISAEEMDGSEEEDDPPSTRTSIFDRL